MPVGRNVDENDLGIGGLDAAHDGIGRSYGKSGAGVNRLGYAGPIDQHLEHGPLLVISGDDNDGKLGHNKNFSSVSRVRAR